MSTKKESKRNFPTYFINTSVKVDNNFSSPVIINVFKFTNVSYKNKTITKIRCPKTLFSLHKQIVNRPLLTGLHSVLRLQTEQLFSRINGQIEIKFREIFREYFGTTFKCCRLQVRALVEKVPRNKIIAYLGKNICLAKTVSQPRHVLAWQLSLTGIYLSSVWHVGITFHSPVLTHHN